MGADIAEELLSNKAHVEEILSDLYKTMDVEDIEDNLLMNHQYHNIDQAMYDKLSDLFLGTELTEAVVSADNIDIDNYVIGKNGM